MRFWAKKSTKHGYPYKVLAINKLCHFLFKNMFSRNAKDHLLACKRPPFTLQNMPSCHAKEALLYGKYPIFMGKQAHKNKTSVNKARLQALKINFQKHYVF